MKRTPQLWKFMQDMMIFGQGGVFIDRYSKPAGEIYGRSPGMKYIDDMNKLLYGDDKMNEGQIVEICKEQNGYSIEVKKPNGGFDTFVAESFQGMVGHVATAMALSDGERHPPMVVRDARRHTYERIRDSLYPGEARYIEETDPEKMRDELGMLRHKLNDANNVMASATKKSDEKDGTINRLVRANDQLEQLDSERSMSISLLAAENRSLKELLAKHKIRLPVKKKPSSKK